MNHINDDYISVSYNKKSVTVSNMSKEDIYFIGLTNNELAHTSWMPTKMGEPILPKGKKFESEITDESFDFYIIYYWFESDSANSSGAVDMKSVKHLKIDKF